MRAGKEREMGGEREREPSRQASRHGGGGPSPPRQTPLDQAYPAGGDAGHAGGGLELRSPPSPRRFPSPERPHRHAGARRPPPRPADRDGGGGGSGGHGHGGGGAGGGDRRRRGGADGAELHGR